MADEEFIKKLVKLSNEGDTEAKIHLSECYSLGYLVEENEEKAFELLTEAAESGNYVAKLNLAMKYKIYRKDLSKAEEWYRKAGYEGEILQKALGKN